MGRGRMSFSQIALLTIAVVAGVPTAALLIALIRRNRRHDR